MLELQNISFGVSESQGKKEILKDISLMVGENKFVVITGPNGGGESTLAKMIMGIEKPRSGKILFDGQDITEKTITERANLGISFALQQPVRFKGVHVLDLIRLAARRTFCCSTPVDSVRGGIMRQGLYQPGGQWKPVRRRIKADRDRHRPGPGHKAFCV